MVCKKIRKAREYPSQSKRSASLRRCIQRGTVQSRCTTQVHGDRKNAYLLVCCQHFSLNTLDTASSRCSAMCIYPRDDLLHLRDYYLINIQATNRRNQERQHIQAFRFCARLTLDKTVWIVKEICAQLFVCTILVYAMELANTRNIKQCNQCNLSISSSVVRNPGNPQNCPN